APSFTLFPYTTLFRSMPAFNFDSPIPTPFFSRAFEEVLPSMKALPDAEGIPVNLDIPDAVSKVLGLERGVEVGGRSARFTGMPRSEEHTSELQSRGHL